MSDWKKQSRIRHDFRRRKDDLRTTDRDEEITSVRPGPDRNRLRLVLVERRADRSRGDP